MLTSLRQFRDYSSPNQAERSRDKLSGRALEGGQPGADGVAGPWISLWNQ